MRTITESHATLQLIEMMGMTIDKHRELVFEVGCEWLDLQTDDTELKTLLLYSREYWDWWQGHWETRNMRLYSSPEPDEVKMESFPRIHHPRLIGDICISRKTIEKATAQMNDMEDDWAPMVNKVIKHGTQQQHT